MKNAIFFKGSFFLLLLFLLLQISFATSSDNNSTSFSSSTTITTSSSLRGGGPLEDDNKKLKQEEEQKKKNTGTETETETGKDDEAETTTDLALLLPRNIEDGNNIVESYNALTMTEDSPDNLQQAQRGLQFSGPPARFTGCLADGDKGYASAWHHAMKICDYDYDRAGAFGILDAEECLDDVLNGRLSFNYRCNDILIRYDMTPCVKPDDADLICDEMGFFRAAFGILEKAWCIYQDYHTHKCYPWPQPKKDGWSPCFSHSDAYARGFNHRDKLAEWWCKNMGNRPGGITGAWNRCWDINLIEEYYTLECKP